MKTSDSPYIIDYINCLSPIPSKTEVEETAKIWGVLRDISIKQEQRKDFETIVKLIESFKLSPVLELLKLETKQKIIKFLSENKDPSNYIIDELQKSILKQI